MCGSIMQILNDIENYKLVYEDIIRKTYRCMKIEYPEIKISEDKFIELCFSDKVYLCNIDKLLSQNIYDILMPVYSTTYEYYNKYYKVIDKEACQYTNNYLIKNFTINNEIDYGLLFANIIYWTEQYDDTDNMLLQFFNNLPIFEKYKKFFYIFPLIQVCSIISTKDISLIYSGIFEYNISLMLMNRLKYFFSSMNLERIEGVIHNELKKFFNEYLDDLKLDDLKYVKYNPSFEYFIKHIDTYKYIDSKEKIRLLAERGIYYWEYSKFNNEYLSEMTYKLINNECVVV